MEKFSIKKINFIGDDKFLFGINELSSQLNFTLSDDGCEVEAIKVDGNTLTIETTKDKAIIYYPKDNSFFKGLSFALQYLGEEKTIKIETLFNNLGTMQNCSESVLTVDALKDFIRQSAIMGYTYIAIYTELTYLVEGEPYLGYKAGAYTTEELKDIVSYSERFFVEAIPYVQTLSHLNQLFRWPAYGEVKDVEDIMLVDYDRSYELIEKMICALRKAYNTSKINLGMDEAYRIGTGRYRWFINEELVDTIDLFIRHLKKVISIAEKYGFTIPEIWFDNIFGMKFKGYIAPPDWLFKDFDEKIRNEFPKIKLNYWYYAIETQEEVKRTIKNVRQLSNELSFSTIIHGYSSYAPINSFAERACDFVKETCLNNGIDDILITSWGMVSPFAMIAGYLKFMESFAVGTGYDLEERAQFLYGNTYTELKQLDLPNEIYFEEKHKLYEYNPPVYIMADDPLLGIMSSHIPFSAKSDYENIAKVLEKNENKGGRYAQIFYYEKIMSLALAEKAPLSKVLKDAYDKKDKKALLETTKQITTAIEKIQQFHRAYRENWLKYFKSFGLELFDMRFGGLVARLGFIKETVLDFVNGKIDKIEELEEVRLPYSKGNENKIICNAGWNEIAIGRNMRL